MPLLLLPRSPSNPTVGQIARGSSLQAALNAINGTTGDEMQHAANVWAGTTNRELVGALNVKNGTTGIELAGVLRALGFTVDGP